jgi:6-phosphogluconolactonase/glucosamine-6-phosphate isomerase/deaminase
MKKHFEKEEKKQKKSKRNKKTPVQPQPFKMGGATGRTQLGVYRRLFELYDEHQNAPESERGQSRVDFSNVEIYFLDEYFGAAPLYYSYARQHLRVGKGGFHADNIWVPRGCFFAPVRTGGRLVNSDMLDAILAQTTGQWKERFEVGEDDERHEKPEIFIKPEATHPVLKKIRRSNRAYHKRVCTRGKGRIALLGLGTHGHIGFVECGAAPPLSDPDDKESKWKGKSEVMLVRLSARTQSDNEADFLLTNGDGNRADLEESRYAITQGIDTIMSAGELLLAAHGGKKAPAVKRMLLDNPGPQNPAGFIQRHKKVRVYLDLAAFGDLQPEELAGRGYEVRRSEKVQQLQATAPGTA